MSAPAPQPPSLAARPPSNRGFIVNPWFDLLFFIGSPLVFLGLGALIGSLGWARVEVSAFGLPPFALIPTLVITFSMGHIVAVFFRSHLNRDIFKLHPWRFIAIPLALITLFLISEPAWVVAFFLIVWADNYHSSMQTFGLGRIYDARAGNHPEAGRRLDFGLALVVFIGPILAGATLLDALDRLHDFDRIGLNHIAQLPGWAEVYQPHVVAPILALGLGYVAYYVYGYWRLSQRGYRVSWQKVALWVVLALVSIYTWGFDSFGQAFLIMESFHAFQYFGIVWWSEQDNMQTRFRLTTVRGGKWWALIIFVGLCLSFGLWVSLFATTRFEAVLFGVCELMHYWYDGFIWSIRKKQVKQVAAA